METVETIVSITSHTPSAAAHADATDTTDTTTTTITNQPPTMTEDDPNDTRLPYGLIIIFGMLVLAVVYVVLHWGDR